MKSKKVKGKAFGTILSLSLMGAALGAMFIPYKRNKIREKVVVGAKDLAGFLNHNVVLPAKDLIHKTEKTIERKSKEFRDKAHEAKENMEDINYQHTESGFKP